MKMYLISYVLKTPGRNYTKLFEVLKSTPKWSHYLDSTWIIMSAEDIKTLSSRIKNELDDKDFFIITEFSKNTKFQGWLPAKAWDWLRENQATLEE